MDFKDPVVKWIDENTTVVGYLSDDHNSSNPLEDMDNKCNEILRANLDKIKISE